MGLPKGSTWGDAVVIGQLRQAIKKTDAAKFITETVEGKPLQKLRLEGTDGGPVQFESTDAEELKKRIADLTERIRSRKSKPRRTAGNLRATGKTESSS